ncbi:aminotransferase class IV [Candidatus Pelagibacter sp. HIMB1695]|uniref:aminotransferase class IV n=1 Tax=Candidatus Pelagibacter sp. HIMB1695 TaxID=3413364 RepID=UPI003F826EA1
MVTLLLKKSYQLSNLKEVPFKDLWGSRGVFTTMRMIGKPPNLLLIKPHLENLIKSTKKYGIRKKNLKNIILDLIKKNTLYKGPDNLFRIALNKKLISISIRKRPKVKKNFSLLLFKYKRIEPNYKNLYYKKILAKLSKVDSSKCDIALVVNNKILETGTSNLVFVKNGKIFSPKKNCYFGNTLKFLSKKIKINFKDISIKEIKDYEEVILIGSGKGVTPVSKIDELKWKNRKNIFFNKLSKIYNTLIST